MITELRRRAYLSAMQVVSWLPRAELPFAAPARLEAEPEPLLHAPLEVAEAAPQAYAEQMAPTAEKTATPIAAVTTAVVTALDDVRATLDQARAPANRSTPVQPESPVVFVDPESIKPTQSVPRFSLQLLRAGDCLVLVELPNGEAFQSRDPGYLLLKDLLRAAGLPNSPQQLGEPIRWPLLASSNLDQGPQAAREFIQGFLAARLEEGPACACLWLVGLSAVRYAGEMDEDMFNRELQIEGLGPAWALPGLELLMDEPQRKAPLWQAMQRVMQRWKPAE